jgi:hypothetical protein
VEGKKMDMSRTLHLHGKAIYISHQVLHEFITRTVHLNDKDSPNSNLVAHTNITHVPSFCCFPETQNSNRFSVREKILNTNTEKGHASDFKVLNNNAAQTFYIISNNSKGQ